jgi:chromosome partitioning protein
MVYRLPKYISVDLWAGAQIASLVAEARSLNERLRACAVLNIADPAGQDNADAGEALRSLDGFEALPGLVVRRKAFPNAFTSGLEPGA